MIYLSILTAFLKATSIFFLYFNWWSQFGHLNTLFPYGTTVPLLSIYGILGNCLLVKITCEDFFSFNFLFHFLVQFRILLQSVETIISLFTTIREGSSSNIAMVTPSVLEISHYYRKNKTRLRMFPCSTPKFIRSE